MNPTIVNDVVAPPIVDFHNKAQKITPANGVKFDMTQAVPSYPTFKPIVEHLKTQLETDSVSFYTDVQGLPELRSAIQNKHPLANYFDESQCLVTSGANHAMYTALKLFFKPSDSVALIQPYYFNYDMALKMMNIKPKYYEANSSEGFHLSSQSMIEWIEENPVKGIILVTPNNPTGAIYDGLEIKKLLDYTSQRGIQLLLDETYLRFDNNHLSERSVGEFLGNGLTLIGSFSKSHSLTGYRVGYLVSGKEEITEALKIQDTMVICAPHISQQAAFFGLIHCDDEVQHRCSEIYEKTKIIEASGQKLNHFSICSSGAYFAYLRHPFKNCDSEAAALLLYEKTGILGLPGEIFGNTQSQFIRLAYCNLSIEKLKAALAELHKLDQTF